MWEPKHDEARPFASSHTGGRRGRRAASLLMPGPQPAPRSLALWTRGQGSGLRDGALVSGALWSQGLSVSISLFARVRMTAPMPWGLSRRLSEVKKRGRWQWSRLAGARLRQLSGAGVTPFLPPPHVSSAVKPRLFCTWSHFRSQVPPRTPRTRSMRSACSPRVGARGPSINGACELEEVDHGCSFCLHSPFVDNLRAGARLGFFCVLSHALNSKGP